MPDISVDIMNSDNLQSGISVMLSDSQQQVNEIPKLEDYDMNPNTGFLPATPPLKRLSDAYYEPWEDLISNMKELLLCGKFRKRVLKLDVLSTDKLKSLKEYQRAFSILTFLEHSFIWGKNEPVSQALPKCIAVPLIEVSKYLGINPVSCNAAVVVWNWKLIDEDGPVDLNNLGILNSFTGSLDEAWFYLNTVAIESKGGLALSSIINALHAIRKSDVQEVTEQLKLLSKAIKEVGQLLDRMYEKCDPYLFYWKLRPYLAGWENMGEAGLPHGIVYQGVDDCDRKRGEPIKFRQYAGGSAAQSALIQAFDIALGIVHYPTSSEWRKLQEIDKKLKEQSQPLPKKTHANYLYSMRDYMPGLHRKFLEDLTKVANIKPFVEEVGGDCAHAYNDCIAYLKDFRDRHIKIVTRYIVLPARKGPSIGSFTIDSEHTIEPDMLNENNVDASLATSINPLSIIQEDEQIGQNGLFTDEPTFIATTSPIPIKTTKRQTTNGSTASPGSNFTGNSPSARESPRLKSVYGSNSIDLSYPQLNHTSGSLPRKSSLKFNIEFGLARAVQSQDSETFRGTGGTDLIPFLKQVRDETTDCALSDNILFPPL